MASREKKKKKGGKKIRQWEDDALEDALRKLKEMEKRGKVNVSEVSRSSEVPSGTLYRYWDEQKEHNLLLEKKKMGPVMHLKML